MQPGEPRIVRHIRRMHETARLRLRQPTRQTRRIPIGQTQHRPRPRERVGDPNAIDTRRPDDEDALSTEIDQDACLGSTPRCRKPALLRQHYYERDAIMARPRERPATASIGDAT